jgi:diadenosine tetraphosphate (Ap4A) HIT family hydrolase
MTVTACPLCEAAGGRELWRDGLCRVVAVDEPSLPGFLRVILNAHAAEMTDLDPADQAHLMRVVLATETLVRRHLRPDKVNLASLGNVVPHVHWHVIPRWRDDCWFPDPIWAPPRHAQAVPADRERLALQFTAGFAEALSRTLNERRSG